MAKSQLMEMHERLQRARKHAGFRTGADAARAIGVEYPTYAGHENGSSGFRPERGELYARRFKVRFEWLMLGAGPMTDLNAAIFDEINRLLPQARPEAIEAALTMLRLGQLPEASPEPTLAPPARPTTRPP